VADKFCQPSGAGQATLRFMVDIIIFGISHIGSDWLIHTHRHMYSYRYQDQA